MYKITVMEVNRENMRGKAHSIYLIIISCPIMKLLPLSKLSFTLEKFLNNAGEYAPTWELLQWVPTKMQATKDSIDHNFILRIINYDQRPFHSREKFIPMASARESISRTEYRWYIRPDQISGDGTSQLGCGAHSSTVLQQGSFNRHWAW